MTVMYMRPGSGNLSPSLLVFLLILICSIPQNMISNIVGFDEMDQLQSHLYIKRF